VAFLEGRRSFDPLKKPDYLRPMDTKCLECGDKIVGRADKKFCSDQCRSAYNNRLNSDHTKIIRNTNHILRKNHRILESFNPDGKGKAKKESLLKKGFKFDYITSFYTTKNGHTYFFCYDQGYLPIENDWYALVKKKEYAEQ
jgi:predicted nucleic acid-binding Zn ribbon protein